MFHCHACRHVKIGNPLQKGISGGQAKRTNIGIALITSPRVLFLDEPTSGLDSFTANEVMTVVQGLASSGVTILATIHSPTAYAFSLFDSLMMLVSTTWDTVSSRVRSDPVVGQHVSDRWRSSKYRMHVCAPQVLVTTVSAC